MGLPHCPTVSTVTGIDFSSQDLRIAVLLWVPRFVLILGGMSFCVLCPGRVLSRCLAHCGCELHHVMLCHVLCDGRV